MNTRALWTLALILSTGCVSTVPDSTHAPVCPEVACAWTAEGQCAGEYSSESTSHAIDDGATTCWVYTAACVTQAVDPACVPDSCKQNQFATCAPTPAGRK